MLAFSEYDSEPFMFVPHKSKHNMLCLRLERLSMALQIQWVTVRHMDTVVTPPKVQAEDLKSTRRTKSTLGGRQVFDICNSAAFKALNKQSV